MKYTVMVINNIFEEDNLLIVKSKGNQSIQRHKQHIEKELVFDYLKGNAIDIDDCVIYIVKNDWRGNPSIEEI